MVVIGLAVGLLLTGRAVTTTGCLVVDVVVVLVLVVEVVRGVVVLGVVLVVVLGWSSITIGCEDEPAKLGDRVDLEASLSPEIEFAEFAKWMAFGDLVGPPPGARVRPSARDKICVRTEINLKFSYPDFFYSLRK